MSNDSINIHFDYGGSYSKTRSRCRWISREDHMYGLSFKTSSLEDITYSVLVDRICRKIAIDEATTKLKLSYIPLVVRPLRQSYIFNDEDVYVYLTSIDKKKCRSVLHVEVINNFEVNQINEQLSEDGRETAFGENYNDLVSDATSNARVTAGNSKREPEYESSSNFVSTYPHRVTYVCGSLPHLRRKVRNATNKEEGRN